jgi:hypothetical protein
MLMGDKLTKSLVILAASILTLSAIAPANAKTAESSAPVGVLSVTPSITAKTLPADYWKTAVSKVRKGIGKATKKAHPMKFSYSPSTLKTHAMIIKDGATQALKAWGRYIDSDIPLTVFVVHPKDRTWFKKKWESIGVWEDWKGAFERPVNGGGAVVIDKAGVPFMWYMASERFVPPKGPIDYYMHEVFHFYQSLDVTPGISTSGDDPCWYVEGSATFLGHANTYTSEAATISEVSPMRQNRTNQIRPYLVDRSGKLREELLKSVFLNGPKVSNDCQHQGPQYGYNLGYFVNELLVYEFGYDKLIDFSLAAKKMEWEQAFSQTYGISAEKWADSSLVSAMKQLFR